MGAALLKTPDKLENILRALVKEVGEPFDIPISVKIRILEDRESTLALVRRLSKTGIKCLSVHCRTTPMRPREPVIRDYLAGIADICHEAGISCIVNGDVRGRFDLAPLMEKYGVDGAMIARAAESNTSCFAATKPGPAGLVDWKTVAREYTNLCAQFDNHHSNTKYCLLQMIPGKDKLYQTVSKAKSVAEMDSALDAAISQSNTTTPIAISTKTTPTTTSTVTFKTPTSTTSNTSTASSEELHLPKRPREESLSETPQKRPLAVNAA
ncbi:Smm1p [Sugiyamaella lignohabitans]|uniref:Smm1p n=1 Tax=Sugiyamaella lignohabitans TaxID=796027 RepID=A0A167F3N0_9ASCO|nr:Smm1p [Sugiyamaella lignohabitans]ANB14786.1 Smm1p [Sugiyamaella lignohabitans]